VGKAGRFAIINKQKADGPRTVSIPLAQTLCSQVVEEGSEISKRGGEEREIYHPKETKGYQGDTREKSGLTAGGMKNVETNTQRIGGRREKNKIRHGSNGVTGEGQVAGEGAPGWKTDALLTFGTSQK